MDVRTILAGWVAGCAKRAWLVLALALALALVCGFLASRQLGLTTNTNLLFSNRLTWKQASDALSRDFPQNNDLLVAVIDARIPEEAEATATALAARLRAQPALFHNVTQPDALPYLQRNAFLLLDTKQLTALMQRTIDAQPFLGQLVADPSLRGLFAALGLVAQGAGMGISAGSLTPALQQFQTALAEAASGHPQPLSWENLLAGPLVKEAGKYHFVLAQPVLHYGALQPGGIATAALRAAAASLPFVRSGAARVRLTGSVALDDEQFASVAQGAAIGLALSFALVLLWLFAALRSWRLMLPVALTLVLGLAFTTGFATLTVGTLNLISVAFAILFVGIAVDFAIQFTVRFRERRYIHPDSVVALRETGRGVGAQILVAALATASGFLAFTPTKFVGVAQLGVIAGGGMLIAFFCTILILPALLAICHPHGESRDVGVNALRKLEPVVRASHWPILGGFALLAAIGLALTPSIPFDGNPLHTNNQHTEAVETLNDLADNPVTNPYTAQALLPSLDAARALSPRLAALPDVQAVMSLASFLPTDQAKKLAIIADASNILSVSLAAPSTPPAFTAADLRAAARTLDARLHAVLPKLKPTDPLRAIAADLDRLQTASDATLLATNTALLRFLPPQLDRLRTALAARKVTLADIPASLRRDWLLPDGQARIKILPRAGTHDSHAIRHFVDQVVGVLPQATGAAMWIVRSAQTIIDAFKFAALGALAAIAVILALALRRLLDVVLVITPLLVSSLLTVALLTLLGISLNFANIIALPLLLGVGVSFNIYFVMNWRQGMARFLGSATARAVIFSALTTGTAFGSLALSAHPGTSSMGKLLLLSLFCTVITTLFFVPALLSVVPKPHVILGGKQP